MAGEMMTAGEIRKGTTFEMDGKIYRVIEFLHVKPGKGAAFVRTTLKNIVTGQVIPKTFNPVDKLEKAHIERKEMVYLYNDGDLYYFMDNDTYEQIPLNKSQVEDAMLYVTENMTCSIQFYKGEAFSVDPPDFVELTITECEPGIQGDTSKAGNKPATVETGLVLQVPLFVNNGEKIRIDTRTGTYMSRV
jgi:elongation factor P